MARAEKNGDSVPSAPYVPTVTFWNSLAKLRDVMPPIIDKSLWSNQSGGTQSALYLAFRFLGLIGEQDAPTPRLRALVNAAEDERKAVVRTMVEASYPDALAIGIDRSTAAQLENVFSEKYGVQGSTRRKAVSFFLSLAEEGGFAISPHFKKTRPTSAARRSSSGRRPRQPRIPVGPIPDSPPPTAIETNGHTTTINLSSGGTLKLVLGGSANFFTMDSPTFTLISDLKARIQKYEEEKAGEDLQNKETDDQE